MKTLADLLTMYGGSGDRRGMTDNIIFRGDGSDEDSGELFNLAKKYDPNARIGEAGDLIFDRSKLPDSGLGDMSRFANPKTGSGNFWDFNRQLRDDGQTMGGADVLDPRAVAKGGEYGNFVDKRAMGRESGDVTTGFMGQMEKYMPQVVGAGMSLASGGLMSPQLIQAMAAAGEGDWKGVGKIAPGLAMSVLGGQIGASFLPTELTTGIQTFKPWISGAKSIYDAANKPSIGSGVGAGLTLADIIKNYGMGGR